MKAYITLVFLIGFSLLSMSQITFNGAHPLFEDQDFIFNFDSIDTTGRHIYTTSPIDGNQPCGGIGICELKFAWNNADEQWEMLADDGNGGFTSAFVIFKNKEASTPNPPSLALGTWEENTDLLISGQAGGDLTASNTVLTGDVQNEVLSTSKLALESLFKIYPNPVNNILNIKTNEVVEIIEIYDLTGKSVLNKSNNLERVNVSELYYGIYFLKIKSNNYSVIKKIMIN